MSNETIIPVLRILTSESGTLGVCTIGDREVFILEDPYHPVKIKGDTRIPPGKYKLSVQIMGRLHTKYRVHPWYKGMLLLNNVPNYVGVMVHAGNTKAHTAGCLLPALTCNLRPLSTSSSLLAMQEFYEFVYSEMAKGNSVYVLVSNE